MWKSKRQTLRGLATLAVLALVLLAVPALADVSNGDFENGGVDWNPTFDPGFGVSFPPAGGHDGGYASLESDFTNIGGRACILQTIQCGQPDDGTECTIAFDFKLTPIAAVPGSGRIIVTIDGISDIVVDMPTPDWEFVSYVVPCGVHVIEICLEVDPFENAWVACIDNVRAVCTGGVPNELDSWGSLKSLYR